MNLKNLDDDIILQLILFPLNDDDFLIIIEETCILIDGEDGLNDIIKRLVKYTTKFSLVDYLISKIDLVIK